MRSTPRLNPLNDGSILSIELLNSLINRVEYGADLIQAYGALAGSNITISQEIFGRVINSTSSTPPTPPTPPPITGTIPWNTRFDANGVNTMNGSPQLYAVTHPLWNKENSKYAVWVNNYQDPLRNQPQTIKRRVKNNLAGWYNVIYSCDNRLELFLKQKIGSIPPLINEAQGFLTRQETVAYWDAGEFEFQFVVENTLGGNTWDTNPAGYSVEITPLVNPASIVVVSGNPTFPVGSAYRNINGHPIAIENSINANVFGSGGIWNVLIPPFTGAGIGVVFGGQTPKEIVISGSFAYTNPNSDPEKTLTVGYYNASGSLTWVDQNYTQSGFGKTFINSYSEPLNRFNVLFSNSSKSGSVFFSNVSFVAYF